MTSESINSFKSLRIEKGLSISDVANKLKLNASVIERIEKNDYKSLGAYTYIRGYVSHYAKLLEVDESIYIAMIPKDELKVPLINTGSNLSQTFKYKHKSRKKTGKYLVGFIFLSLVGLAIWFGLENYTTLLNKKNSNQELIEDNSILISPQLNISPENSEDIDTIQIPQESNELNDNELTLPIQNNNQTDDNANQINLTSQQMTTAQDTKVTEDTSDIFTVEQPQEQPQEQLLKKQKEKDQVNEVQTPAQEVPRSKYVIEIQALTTSWVKVEHINGKKLHNDLLKPGTITLESDKPLHFRIGNKSKVKVKINGEQLNLSNYSHKNIADFNWPLN